ncbi:MAG: hypothetical protein IKW83_07530 [Muribaculaceae bacterium]|nr:hypothetical protein [Muribaculaceae bacterium]
MRRRKILSIGLLTAICAAAFALTATSCNRMLTYEDGMFDYNEIYTDEATNDTFQINSEIDNDDTERY